MQNWFNWPPAAILLFAATLKSYQLSTVPYVENLFLQSRTISIFLIGFEVALGMGLVCGLAAQSLRRIGFTTFSVFLAYAIILAFTGERHCGCFGILEVPLWATIGCDIVMLGFLWFWLPCDPQESRLFALVSAPLLTIALVLPVLNFQTGSISEVGEIVGEGVIAIAPEKWNGEYLPLSDYILGGKEYLVGRWNLVLYHDDCPQCQKLIRHVSLEPGNMTVFVEVPPHISPIRPDQSKLLWRKLTDQHRWFVKAPVSIELENGFVVSTTSSFETD